MTTKTEPQRRQRVRKGETIGGGFFVFRRGHKSGRVFTFNGAPFEHPTFESALAEATRLAAKYKGRKFEVFQTSGAVALCEAVSSEAKAEAA